jgi:hypothetical protein
MYNLPEMRADNARFWEALQELSVEAGLRDLPERLTFDRLPAEPSTLMGSGNTKPPRSAAGGIERNRKFVDSLLEQAGFEPPVPCNTMHLRTAFFTSPDTALKVQQKG